MKINIYLICLLAITFTGCSDIENLFQKSDACDSEQTLSLVRSGILKGVSNNKKTLSFLNEEMVNKFSNREFSNEDLNEAMQFEFIREEAYDEKVEKRLCKATIISGNSEIPITYQSKYFGSGQRVNMNHGMTYLDLIKIMEHLIEVQEKNKQSETVNQPSSVIEASGKELFPMNKNGPVKLKFIGKYHSTECFDHCFINFIVNGRADYINGTENFMTLVENNKDATFEVAAQRDSKGYYTPIDIKIVKN